MASTLNKLAMHSFLKTSNSDFVTTEYQKFMPECPSPGYFSEAELNAVFYDRKADILKENCCEFDYAQGVVKLTDKQAIETSRSVTIEMVKKLGKSVISSNAIGTSLPCCMFEPRSEIDRFGELWRLIAYYYTKAGNITDKIERMKLVATAEIAGNYLSMRKMKSFNPLLGETFECFTSDGSQISLEQISHHPPITAYYAEGPKKCYTHSGSEEVDGSFQGNSLLISMKSRGSLKFKDNQEIIWIKRPSIKIGGIMFGETCMLIKGPCIFMDKKNKIKCAIFFDYGEKKGMFTTSKTVSKDKVEGIIYIPKEGGEFSGSERRVSELKDIKTEIARIKGSWFENVAINDVNYWHVDKIMPLKIILPKNPLPSDCRYREDMIYLRRKNVSYADAWKDALEIRQRQDRAQREKYSKK